MGTIKKYYKEPICSYPGDKQIALFDWKTFMEEVGNTEETNAEPTINMGECTDHFKVEIAAPGHQREDFVVGVCGHQLSVLAQRPENEDSVQDYSLHEFDCETFSRMIDLPDNIDSDFIRAEYIAGILSIYFPKVSKCAANTTHRIVIY